MAALNKILLSDNITELGNVKSVVFSETVNSDVNLRPGCVASASIEVEVFNTQANAVAAGDVVHYYQNDKNNTPTLIGKFNCEPSIKTKNSYRFIAYDNAQKLNADFSQWLQANQSNFPMTVYALVSAACTVAGVSLGSASWPLSTQNVQAFYADGLTCRDILSYAAEIACKFVRCHTDGKLYFDWYTSNSNSIAPSAGTGIYAYKQSGLTYANFTTTALARVAVHPSGEDDVAYIYPVNVTSGNTLDIKDNLLLTGADASFYNSVAQTVYTAMSSLGAYRPMTASLFPRENPFRAGDIVSVTDSQSVTFTAPITGQTVSNSAATLESVGNETYTDYSGSAKGLTQLASDIVRINKLKVDWAEINTAIINFLTANNITAQNLTIVDEYGNVLATYDASGITLGQTAEAHAEMDYHSFQLIDKDGNIYLYASDLRDSSGLAELTETFVGDGSRKTFYVGARANSATSVTVDGVEQTQGTDYTFSIYGFTFSTPPSNGSSIVIVYKTYSDEAKAFTFGVRGSGTIGMQSVVLGYKSVASGRAAVAEGLKTVASGLCSHAEGSYIQVNGVDYYPTASGNYSHAEGAGAIASGECSHAQGKGTIATGDCQSVLGRFNISDSSEQFAEIVGNGTNENTRSNIRTLDWGGNEYLHGNIYVRDGNRLTPVHVSIPSFSSIPHTHYNSKIKSGMRMFNPVWGTPANAPNDCTYTTADGSMTISGTITGATTFECDLIFCD